MKIKVTTKMRQIPNIEIDGVNIIGMDYQERLKKLSLIADKIPELPNWFEELLLTLCLQFGEKFPNGNIYEFTYELEL